MSMNSCSFKQNSRIELTKVDSKLRDFFLRLQMCIACCPELNIFREKVLGHIHLHQLCFCFLWLQIRKLPCITQASSVWINVSIVLSKLVNHDKFGIFSMTKVCFFCCGS